MGNKETGKREEDKDNVNFMDNGFIWFFSISGFVLGLLGLIIGVWDLTVDLEDREQDKDSLHLTQTESEGGDTKWRKIGLLARLRILVRYARRLPK